MKKRIFAVLFAIVLFACLFPVSALASPAADLTIRLEPHAGETEQAAAAVLQEYLEKITGTRPAITEAEAAGQTVALRIKEKEQGLKKGAYTLRGGVAACVLIGAFVAVLIVLNRNMLNGLNSHLAYFTVCLVLEGVALLGFLILLPCAFFKKRGKSE